MYKLKLSGEILHPDGFAFAAVAENRYYQEYQAWLALGNTPEPADEPTPEQLAREAEVEQPPLTARQFFAQNPAAVAFIRLTPEEQAAQLDGMTLAQTKTVVKYLVVAVSAMIKREFLG